MRALWRIGWLRGLVTFLLLLLLAWTTDPKVVTGLEVAVGFVAFTIASFWGLGNLRRLMPRIPEAFRDSLLASLTIYLLFRGLLDLFRGTGAVQAVIFLPQVAPLFVNVVSGMGSLVLFPILVWFCLTLVAITSMATEKDTAAERSILPLFWPTLLLSVALDCLLGLRLQTLWPPMALTLASPFTALFLVRALRHRELDAQSLFWQLTMLLQRKCTRKQGRGPKDIRGIVLGLLAGAITLCFGIPVVHAFVAPYEGASYTAATQMANHLLGLRSFMASNGESGSKVLFQMIPSAKKQQESYQNIIVLTYDDPVRRRAQETSEVAVQAALLEKLAPVHPVSIALPLPPEDGDEPIFVDATTPSPGKRAHQRNTRDFPQLAKAIQAAGVVYIGLPSDEKSKLTDETTAVVKQARAVGTMEIHAQGTGDAPAVALTSMPFPLCRIITEKGRSLRLPEGLSLIDYRLDLQQVRMPLPLSQVLSGEKLYDAPTRRWLTPREFFADKRVFVEALAPHTHQTPAGPRGEMEIQAQATANLLHGQPFGTVPFGIIALVVLVLSAVVGQLCVGRAPLEALWRVALPIVLAGGACFAMTAFGSYRTDPVLPVLGGVLAFVMVTQFTFAVERDERSRNRSLLTRFIPPQAVEELLDDPEGKLGLGGKRRRIVVLFADVRGFSGFAEKSTPEEVVATMNRYLMVMTDALNDHDGILDKYTGDGLMALFLVDENKAEADVLRAVRAAEAMAKAVLDLAKTMQTEGGAELAVGLGLHYGEAVVGLVGHPTRQVNYTALGHTVVVAARLQTLAAGGDIIVSDAVYRALPSGTLTAEAGETVTVKGVADPVQIYRIRVQ